MLGAHRLQSFITALVCLELVPSGMALPRSTELTDMVFRSIARRDGTRGTWEVETQVTEAFAKQGLCRYYIYHPSGKDDLTLDSCRKFCNNPNVMCHSDYCTADKPEFCKDGQGPIDTSNTQMDPDGDRYIPGDCKCNTELAEDIVEFVVDGLAKSLEGISCAVWLEAAKNSAKILSLLLPGSTFLFKAFKSLAKTVDKVASTGGGQGRWQQFIEDKCGIEGWEGFNWGDAWHVLNDKDVQIKLGIK